MNFYVSSQIQATTLILCGSCFAATRRHYLLRVVRAGRGVGRPEIESGGTYPHPLAGGALPVAKLGNFATGNFRKK